MPPQRVTVTIPRDTGLPEDVTVLTFHVATPADVKLTSGAGGSWNSMTGAILKFFNVGVGVEASVGSLFSSISNGLASRIAAIDLNDPTPRVPYNEEGIAIVTNAATASLPEEVAICSSYQATPESGLIQARRRGRLFLGPLHTGTLSTVGGRVRPAAGVASAIAASTKRLKQEIEDIGVQFNWVVWSRVNLTEADIAEGWVDDAFDTQRRRGPAATSRTIWTD